jgi:hypothetical protein
LLLLRVFKVDVLEILHRLALYSMIGRPKISNIHKINQQNSKQMIINNMMQWIDRVFTTKLLAQKSLKTELRLKRYKVLKF